LLDSYAGGVLAGIEGVEQVLGSGRLRFACAAHGDVGSSQKIFEWLAKANVRLLAQDVDQLTETQLAEIANMPLY
jgi:hypothetical protein